MATYAMTDPFCAEWEKRMENAMRARKMAGAYWGKNYWDVVIAYLLRQANRLN